METHVRTPQDVFGPPGSPVARGIDILTLRDSRVIAVRTLLVPDTDA